MRVGFIGTGSMGSILIESLITAHALQPDQVIVSNRTKEKVVVLQDKYPGLKAAKTNIETVENSDIIFFCVKPKEFKHLIDEVRYHLNSDQIVVSITTPVQIHDLEELLPCKIAKIVPSITNYVHSGASLFITGSRCTAADAQRLRDLVSKISRPLEIDEAYTRVSSDIVSCGPAFMSFMLQRFIDAAVEETGISRGAATFFASEMIVGLANLISEGPFTLETLQERVCVPGGVTGAGIAALEKMNPVFNDLFKNTHDKHREDLAMLNKMFHD
jgi:competence protein ComER